METLESKTITIPYEDYKEMLEKNCLYECFMKDLEYLIDDSELDYYKKDLEISSSVKQFAKKYCPEKYSSKLIQLEYKYEKSKESEE